MLIVYKYIYISYKTFLHEYPTYFSLLSMVTNFAALLSIGGFVAAIEFQSNFYFLYPLVAIFRLAQ